MRKRLNETEQCKLNETNLKKTDARTGQSENSSIAYLDRMIEIADKIIAKLNETEEGRQELSRIADMYNIITQADKNPKELQLNVGDRVIITQGKYQLCKGTIINYLDYNDTWSVMLDKFSDYPINFSKDCIELFHNFL